MNEIEKKLRNWKNEVLKDIKLFGINESVVVFYTKKENGIHFIDYEIVGGTTYIHYYEKEKNEILSLKELLFVISDLLYPSILDEVRTIWVNMWIQEWNQVKLAKALGVGRQVVVGMLNNNIPISEEIYIKISIILKFDVDEYFRIKSSYKFDESDL